LRTSDAPAAEAFTVNARRSSNLIKEQLHHLAFTAKKKSNSDQQVNTSLEQSICIFTYPSHISITMLSKLSTVTFTQLRSAGSISRASVGATGLSQSIFCSPRYDRSVAFSSDAGSSGKNLLTHEEGVHQTMKISKSWRNKPLFRRQGDVRFKTGMEASNLLIRESLRRDSHEQDYIDSVTSVMQCLSPIFDRNPKYAFVAKTLIEPERFIQFRVAWIDDVGVNRLNRGFRVQYSSALGPYAGSLHLGPHVTHNIVHANAFDTVFSNAVTGHGLGAAVGGSDFNPLDKSEAELQRFCQSYATELAKYIGPDQDIPFVGFGCGREEMGYIYGQYKRIKPNGYFMAQYDMELVCTDHEKNIGLLHRSHSSVVLSVVITDSWLYRGPFCQSHVGGPWRFLEGQTRHVDWCRTTSASCR
jgi:Glu/Leu/Phe/Val dehydrogenase, dimerisation domain